MLFSLYCTWHFLHIGPLNILANVRIISRIQSTNPFLHGSLLIYCRGYCGTFYITWCEKYNAMLSQSRVIWLRNVQEKIKEKQKIACQSVFTQTCNFFKETPKDSMPCLWSNFWCTKMLYMPILNYAMDYRMFRILIGVTLVCSHHW